MARDSGFGPTEAHKRARFETDAEKAISGAAEDWSHPATSSPPRLPRLPGEELPEWGTVIHHPPAKDWGLGALENKVEVFPAGPKK